MTSLLCTHLPPTWPATVDHCVSYFGDVQLYRGHSWALTHPLTYAGVGIDGRGDNVMLHRGMGQAKEWRGSNAVYSGTDWVFTAATSGGTILPSKFYQPPPTWLFEHSRSILWIQGDPTSGAGVDTLIVFDRSHVDDPLTLAGFDKYDDTVQSRMEAHALRLWRWHAPVAPTIAGHTATWPIADGETCRVTWLRDDQALVTDQAVAWPNPPYSMEPTERHFHLDLVPDDVPGFETLATVLEFGDPSLFSTVTRHDDPSQCVQAVTLERAGRATWVALTSV